MLAFISENAGTLIVLAILVAVIVAVMCLLRRDKKSGKSSCGSGCAGCPMSGKCHESKSDK